MKKRIQLHILLIVVLLFAGCKKNTTPATPVNGAACKPTSESTTLSGNNDTYKYTYDAGGKISTITKFPTAFPGALKDSIIVTDLGKTSYSQTSAYPVEAHTNWGSYFNQLPPSASVSITERGVTQVKYWVYQFTYDTKNRLVEVNESTPTQIGDYEYDLSIAYNDKDNVSSLRYSNSTGPVTITAIAAEGYDDKPSPYTGIKNWYLLMTAGWNNYDPAPIFIALSKNNPLGYTLTSGFKRTMSYIYNDKGFPLKRMNTNTNPNGSTYSFEETYNYQCQ